MNLDSFAPFTLLHAITAGVFLASVVVFIVLGRRWRGTARERTLRLSMGWSIVATQVFSIAWFLMPARYQPAISFPLQICDLMPWVGAIALLRGSRWSVATAYFLGIGLTTQAFVSPTVPVGPTAVRFWIFWIVHAQILGCGLYPMLVQGVRHGLRGYGLATTFLLAYAGVILPFDIASGLNYGFIGPSKPDVPTIIDALGPWPGRLLWMFAAAQVMMAVLLLPGAIGAMRERAVHSRG
ncbi:MAG: TIGR02206 family membrane protein [Planctomycetota bacterium]|nr:TIGR02206 family membrane protein [Planctomycetota bacterium]